MSLSGLASLPESEAAFDPSSPVPSAVDFSQRNSKDASNDLSKNIPAKNLVSPLLLTPGVFPYQPNPIAAIIAVGVTEAVMSLKEGRGINVSGIADVLNSTRFYYGLIGSSSAALTEYGGSSLIKLIGKYGAPQIYANQSVSFWAGMINGFTYLFATASGFEYFSDIWAHATLKIPECQTMSGFYHARPSRRSQVMMNLFNYYMVDPNMQQRIINSVFYHRILTFEFISTQIAIFAGHMIGLLIAEKYKDAPFLKRYLIRLGYTASISALLGLLIQFLTPNAVKNKANSELLSMKTWMVERDFNSALRNLDDGVRRKVYPVAELGWKGFWRAQKNLQSDIDWVLQQMDLLSSLRLQQALYQDGDRKNFTENVLADQEKAAALLAKIIQELPDGTEPVEAKIKDWINENRSPEEIENLSSDLTALSQAKFYKVLLEAGLNRAEERQTEIRGLTNALDKPIDLSALSENLAVEGK